VRGHGHGDLLNLGGDLDLDVEVHGSERNLLASPFSRDSCSLSPLDRHERRDLFGQESSAKELSEVKEVTAVR
jgi:hypothetical protein